MVFGGLQACCAVPPLGSTRRLSKGVCRELKAMPDKSVLMGRLSERVDKIPLMGRYHRAPAKLWDDYVVQSKVLGKGINGVVKMAMRKNDPSSSQKFAVKELSLANLDQSSRKQLEDEVLILLCVDHPHIARLFDVYETDDTLTLVMECLEGGELFDRLEEKQAFCEEEAADAAYQMLLAVNYMHSHGIVHRDLKLENFLYESKGSNHLKLIDFGFGQICGLGTTLHHSVGTLPYAAPEVLAKKDYNSKCDMWSLGTVVYMLLVGTVPFSGSDDAVIKKILIGSYQTHRGRWKDVSKDAMDFVRSLMTFHPEERLSADDALSHQWMSTRLKQKPAMAVGQSVLDALLQFSQAPTFFRCSMEMMAWSLTYDERAKVRQYFLAMDQNHQGTIMLWELRNILDRYCLQDHEMLDIFNKLDTNGDQEIHYSDFLAAMLKNRIALSDGLLHSTFTKFDVDKSGFITVDNLRCLLGDTFRGEKIEKLVADVDQSREGHISYPDFVEYLTGEGSPKSTGCDDDGEWIPQFHLDLSFDIDDKPRRTRSAIFEQVGNEDKIDLDQKGWKVSRVAASAASRIARINGRRGSVC